MNNKEEEKAKNENEEKKDEDKHRRLQKGKKCKQEFESKLIHYIHKTKMKKKNM